MNIKRLELFNIALESTKQKLREHPNYFILKSIIEQLLFLIKIEEGEEIDISDLKSMTIGRIAAYDIDNLDSNLASILHEVAAQIPAMQRKYAE